MSRLTLVLVFVFVVGGVATSAARAQPHGYAPLAYSGTLELHGQPVDGSQQMRFGLFLSQGSSAACLATANCPDWWEEHASVDVVNGRFSVALGDSTVIPAALLAEPDLSLGVAVYDDTLGWIVLGGLHRLLAVPRAARTEQIVPPVGSIVAWHPGLFPGGPPTLPVGWVRCDGQVLNDSESPLYGATVPNLNGQGRFLRGGNTSGALQDDRMQTHKHLDSGHQHTFQRPRWFGNETPDGVYMFNPEAAVANSQQWTTDVGNAQLGAPVDLDGNTTARHGDETRPTNMSVVWIMRVR